MGSDKEEQKKKVAKPAEAKKEAPKPAETKPAPAKPATPPAPAKPPAAAAPPAKEPEPPAFEKGLAQELVTRFGDAVKIVYIKPVRIKVETSPSNIVEVATYLRDSMGFDHAESASGTD
ncbi:MAG TPA: NADH-quinone oxidoreductase subunit C, partial [Nitrososphaera sp.]